MKLSPPLQTTAEQDLELIHMKRAMTATGSSGGLCVACADVRSRDWSGQRAMPQGKRHSCNIRETPEWRRGPEGARTLCNACGCMRGDTRPRVV
ncbi:hypothetical protein B0H10DRAFT_1799789 [Mycena sp. CBHHK59/15]|nr:hypothetical protein B0H10DRAFT_1799789 [Mycena sp. CBHHK59/15]